MASNASLAQRLVRDNIARLTPYTSARDAKTRAPVGLDANETWAPLLADVQVGANTLRVNRYPEPQPPRLRQRLSELWGAGSEARVLLGRGADDGIDWLIRAFCDPGKDSIVQCVPTYGMYRVAAEIHGAWVDNIPLVSKGDDFALDTEALTRNFPERGKILFLCSPNNPTAQGLDASTLKEVLDALKDRALVVVDEAYIEFSGLQSMSAWLPQYPNLVILRTLSKAWGLAGVRLGGVVAHEAVINILNRVRAPYPLSAPAIALAEAVVLAPDALATMQARVAQTLEERDKLAQALSDFAMVEKVFSSQANFLLVRFAQGQATRVLEDALAAGIQLRDRQSELGLGDCLRITVGSPEQNEQLLAALAAISRAG